MIGRRRASLISRAIAEYAMAKQHIEAQRRLEEIAREAYARWISEEEVAMIQALPEKLSSMFPKEVASTIYVGSKGEGEVLLNLVMTDEERMAGKRFYGMGRGNYAVVDAPDLWAEAAPLKELINQLNRRCYNLAQELYENIVQTKSLSALKKAWPDAVPIIEKVEYHGRERLAGDKERPERPLEAILSRNLLAAPSEGEKS